MMIITVGLLAGSATLSRGFDSSLRAMVKPYVFTIAGWELKTIPREVNQLLSRRQQKVDDEIGTVTGYFAATGRLQSLRSAIANTGSDEGRRASFAAELKSLQEQTGVEETAVKRIIARQIRETLAEQGIFNPLNGLKFSFPPINFRLEKPPYLLVVSPRDKIESMKTVTLQPGIILTEIKALEGRVDEMGVSALVVELGGLGATYPTLVNNETTLRYALDTATHEWLHQYLAFKPLGLRYLLDITGLAENYDITTMNETLAGMVSEEIGAMVYQKYYSGSKDAFEAENTLSSAFDFNREMREIRQKVDVYLARGEIAAAEKFMEEKRQYLVGRGYGIRKLNQAYFAFYGAYADSPTSISPIGRDLRKLREQSISLKDFLNRAAAMSNRQDLSRSLQ